jgi:hypothetical protein
VHRRMDTELHSAGKLSQQKAMAVRKCTQSVMPSTHWDSMLRDALLWDSPDAAPIQ